MARCRVASPPRRGGPQIVAALKAAITQGQLVALSGIVSCSKITTLHRLHEVLGQEPNIVVSRSLAVDKDRVHLGTLNMALFSDLAPEQDVTIPTQPEKRERQLLALSHRRWKTVALCIDEAHDLHSRTLLGVKRLMALVRASGERLSVVLAGHPKLTNDLRRPAMEAIGSRATVFLLDGVKGQQRAYITRLLDQCPTAQARADRLTDLALTLLADRLTTPLQIESSLTRTLEEGQTIGQQPLTPDLIESVLARDLDDSEPRLTRHGDNVKALAALLQVRPTDIRAFLASWLPSSRTQELQQELLAAGLPV